jgi:drug/metabolite transporter (DMT)-like permease
LNRSKAYALLLINTILWGISSPIIKYSLDTGISPNQFLLGRYLIASLIFLPLYLFWFKSPKTKGVSSKKLILLALLGTPLTLLPLYIGLEMTSSIDAAILVATGPITTIIGGYLFLKEKISPREKIGVIVCSAGTAVIILEPLINTSTTHPGSILGNGLILLSNLIWTAFLLLDKKYKAEPSQISLISYLVSIPFFALITLLEPISTENILTNIFAGPGTLGILYMAIFGSIIAFWAYSAGQKIIEASEAAIFTYLQPLFAIPLAIFWLKESVTLPFTLGCLIAALGVFISETKKNSVKIKLTRYPATAGKGKNRPQMI